MKWWKKLLISLGTIGVVVGGSWGIINLIPVSKVVESNSWMKTDKTFISAHRGGSQLNPENTQMAFDYTIKTTTYTNMIELDVRNTHDNVIVINHDDSINRMGTESGVEPVYIADYNYDELTTFNLGRNFVARDGGKPYLNYTNTEAKDAGLTIMKFEDFLTRYQNYRDFRLILEIKDSGEAANTMADRIEELFAKAEYSWWKERTMIISFTDSVIDYIAKTYPEQYVGPLGYKIATELILQKLALNSTYKPNFQCLQTRMSNSAGPITLNAATKGLVNTCHAHNQAITYWTIDNKEDMQKLVNIGADIITTNAPDYLNEVLNG